MGIGSSFITRRTAAAVETVRQQMDRPQWQEGHSPRKDSGILSVERLGTN
jgi:hypothetical protein